MCIVVILTACRLECQSRALMKTEQQVHDMHGIAGRTLEQEIHHGMHCEQPGMLVLVKVDKAFVGILNIGSDDGTVHNEHKVVVIIVLVIHLADHLVINSTLETDCYRKRAPLSKFTHGQSDRLVKT